MGNENGFSCDGVMVMAVMVVWLFSILRYRQYLVP